MLLSFFDTNITGDAQELFDFLMIPLLTIYLPVMSLTAVDCVSLFE